MTARPHLLLSAGVVLVLAAGWRSSGAEDKDPIRDKLVAAKTTYDNEMKQAQKQVEDWLEKREATARKDGNKKLLDQVKEERKAFEEDGELPKALPATIKQRRDRAAKAMDTAYAEAVKAYTRAKRDDEAAAVEAAWKEFAAKASVIDLLPLVDPKAHATVGEWKRDGKALVVSGGDGGQPTLQLPYEPGEEYDLELTVRRVEGNDGLFIGLVAGARRVNVMIDGVHGSDYVSGFEYVDGKRVVEENATRVKGRVLTGDTGHTITCAVRKEKIEVFADGKPLTSYKGAFSHLSIYEGYKIPNKNALALISLLKSKISFERIAVVPVKGKGTIVK